MNEEQLPNLGISPHAPYTLESEPFVDLPDIARQLNMRLHIHLAETPLEAGTYPPVLTTYSAADWSDHDWESYRQLKEVGKGASAIQFVDQLGSLGPDVHIAHGVGPMARIGVFYVSAAWAWPCAPDRIALPTPAKMHRCANTSRKAIW